MSAKWCDICKLNFLDDYAFHGHLLGKKHLKNANWKKEKRQKEQKSIFVSPIPPWSSANEIITFFTQFGKIDHYKFGPRYAIIEFNSTEPAGFLLRKGILIYLRGWKLKIWPRIIETAKKEVNEKANQSPSSSKNDESVLNKPETESEEDDVDTVTIQLEEETTFDAQLDRLLSIVQNDDDEVKSRCDEVCSSLDRVIRSVFPRCRAIRFGSTVTGLHLKGSDMDLFLDTGEPIREDDDPKPEHGYPKSVWTSKLVFNQVKSILYRYKNIFTKVIPIPLAKIPIIKFNHIPTNTDCDISFKSSLGVHNSQLIKHLLTLDPRVKPLMLILKYWGKRLDISGARKITNYCLVIAIIFYLQQPNLQILPTIKQIQSTVTPIFLSGWQINFDVNYRQKSSCQSSIPELMYQFFSFYADFNFNNIICPLDGTFHPKLEYPKIAEKMGINIEQLNLTKPACIQDPLKLDHNIASGWTDQSVREFQSYCTAAMRICEYEARVNYDTLLSSLYDSSNKQQSKKPKKFVISIPAGQLRNVNLPDDFESKPNDEATQKFIEHNWFLTIYEIIVQIFEKIFKLDVEVRCNMAIKQIKINEDTDVHSNKKEEIILLCKGNYCLSRNRKKHPVYLDNKLSPIDQEARVSDQILETLKKQKNVSPIKFKCSILKKNNPLYVQMTLTDVQVTNKAFSELSIYMRARIPKLIVKELLHMACNQKMTLSNVNNEVKSVVVNNESKTTENCNCELEEKL